MLHSNATRHTRRRTTLAPALALPLALAALVASCAPAAPPAGATLPATSAAVVPTCRMPLADATGAGAVRWVMSEPADRHLLDAWCAAVGPPVVTSSAPAATAPAPVDSILVVTWNVNVGGGDIDAFVADLRAGRLTGAGAVTDFVLLLQEAYRDGPAVPPVRFGSRAPRRIAERPPAGGRSDIVATAHRLGLELVYVPSMRNGDGARGDPPEDRGNAILATLPLHEPAAIELPFEAQRRVVAAATVASVDAAGRHWSARVASVHLDHRSRLERAFASLGPARTRQARAVVDAFAGDAAVVIGGDLNTWSIAPLDRAAAVVHEHFGDAPADDGQPTFAAAGVLPLQLDYLFMRAAGARATGPRRVDDRYGSDHHAVFAWVRF